MSPPIHVGQSVTFRFQAQDENGTVLDISTAVTKEVLIEDAAGRTVAHAASFTGDGTDGYYEYRTVTADIALPGRYSAQGHIEHTTGDHSYTKKQRFTVEEVLGS